MLRIPLFKKNQNLFMFFDKKYPLNKFKKISIN